MMKTDRDAGRTRVDVYEMATARVLAALDRGTVPWRRPWRAGGSVPVNFATGYPYRGINVFLLWMAGYESPHWLTAKQAAELGGQVRDDEPSTPAVLWKHTQQRLKDDAAVAAARAKGLRVSHDEQGAYTTRFLGLEFALYSVQQIDGLSDVPRWDAEPREVTWSPDERAEQIVSGYVDGPTVSEGGTVASYDVAADHVQMPDRHRFDDETGWYPVKFHELAHSTAHDRRLRRRDIRARFGSKKYAREELTAEMASAMLCAVAGIDTAALTENQAAYVEHWRTKIDKDPRLVVLAAQRAQRACDHILGVGPTSDAGGGRSS